MLTGFALQKKAYRGLVNLEILPVIKQSGIWDFVIGTRLELQRTKWRNLP